MIRRILDTVPGVAALAAGLLLLLGAPAGAGAAEFWLRAETVSATMPDGRVVPLWGFALDTDGDFATIEGPATVPGPALVVPPGEGLTIHLKNLNIPEGVSVILPAQALPTGGGGPVSFIPADGTGRSRVRSFVHEVETGLTADYVWPSLRPGTHLYQSGSHPAVQVQMGLYGALEIDTAAGNAYGVPGSAYDQDLLLVYSEIDPALHDAVAAGQYGPGQPVQSTMGYLPKYFLVNGKPYSPARSPLPLGAAGGTTLLRFVNAGLETHLPALVGAGAVTLLAEDGNLAPFARQAEQVELPAGKTVDATLVVPAAGYYPLYDRKLALTNDLRPDGGMVAFLAVAAPETVTLSVAKDGTGGGSVAVVSAPGGINCGGDCTENYNRHTRVTLRGTPNASSLLTGWSGGGRECAGLGDCVTLLGSTRTITATFTRYTAVTVVSPNGGESIPEKGLTTIRWGAPAAAETFTLHYSLNGGSSWTQIERGVTGRSFVWEAPGVSSSRTTCLVRVRGFNASGGSVGVDVSDASFTIANVP